MPIIFLSLNEDKVTRTRISWKKIVIKLKQKGHCWHIKWDIREIKKEIWGNLTFDMYIKTIQNFAHFFKWDIWIHDI